MNKNYKEALFIRQPANSDKWTAVLAWTAILLSCAAVFFGNLRFGRDLLAVGYEDDFFYYAQIAHNLAFHGLSSFDGIHLTNGYHPLWLLVITAVTWLLDRGGAFHAVTQLPFAVALETLQSAIVIGICWLTLKLYRQLCSERAAIGLVLLQASFSIVLVRTGMEAGLTLASCVALLCFRIRPGFSWSTRSAFGYGMLASLCVLSRLDTILLVGLLLLLDIAPAVISGSAQLLQTSCFLVGMWPVVVYLALSHTIFGVFTPVSGMAKQMRFHAVPSRTGLQSFFGFFTAAGSPLLGLCCLATLMALAALAVRRTGVPSTKARVFVAFLIFPFLQLLATVTLSDWKLWPWYLYPWVLAGTVGGGILSGQWELKSRLPSRAGYAWVTLCCLFLLGYSGMVARSSDPSHNLTYAAGLEIRQFAASHPGLYAMGDRSGAVGYLIDQPLVQLEGLTMDKAFLANIRAQRDLEPVLREYGVRYYISTRSAPGADGCYPVKEPWQAGPDSPAMHDRLCSTPLAVLHHGPFTNHIFQVPSVAP